MSLLLNICKYNNCGLVFPNLNQLIQHIEREHINFDTGYVEKLETSKPAALPLSYVLPSNIELMECLESDDEHERPSSSALTDAEQQSSTLIPLSDDISNISESTETNFEDEIDPDDTFTFDFIMRYGSKRSINQFDEKPFVCPMPNCTKRYKNVNGLRYHARNGHKKNIKPAKKYECYCGRGYKTSQGLRAHAMSLHNIALILPSSSSLPQSEDTSSLLTLTNMPNNAFEQMHELSVANDTRHALQNRPFSAEFDVEADYPLALSLTHEACTGNSAKLDLNPECVTKLECIELEPDEDSSNSSCSAWQEASDADEKTIQIDIERIKSESIDDDDIDVGDAKDTVFPYHH